MYTLVGLLLLAAVPSTARAEGDPCGGKCLAASNTHCNEEKRVCAPGRCESGYHWEAQAPAPGKCERGSCGPGFQADATTAECKPEGCATANQHRNDNGFCVDNPCPGGGYRDQAGGCVEPVAEQPVPKKKAKKKRRA